MRDVGKTCRRDCPASATNMNYVLKQKLVSLGNNFTIKGLDGAEAFQVKGELASLGDKLSFEDLDGNELVYIEQKIFNWVAYYELWRDGKRLADVKRDFFSFRRHRFTVDVEGSDDLEAVGDFLNWEYNLKRGDRKIATFTRQWFRLSPTFFIGIEDDESDHTLVLAVALVILVVTARRHNY